jgi:hypothetical protein
MISLPGIFVGHQLEQALDRGPAELVVAGGVLRLRGQDGADGRLEAPRVGAVLVPDEERAAPGEQLLDRLGEGRLLDGLVVPRHREVVRRVRGDPAP